LGIGDWGLGIGDWAQSPIPNPQSPIPMLFNKIKTLYNDLFILINLTLEKNIKKYIKISKNEFIDFIKNFNLMIFLIIFYMYNMKII